MLNEKKISRWSLLMIIPAALLSCKKDYHAPPPENNTIKIENVLNSEPLVESGLFQGTGTPALILPGQSVNIQFSAAPLAV